MCHVGNLTIGPVNLLLSVLMSKLPPELRLIASRKFSEADKWNLTRQPAGDGGGGSPS